MNKMFEFISRFFKSKERDLDIGTIANTIIDKLYSMQDEEGNYEYGWPQILNAYQNDMENYVVFTDGGKLYKAVYSVVNNGRDIEITNISQVVVEYPEVEESESESRMIITRNADNELLFFAIAGSAVLNRSGELDSTTFFDTLEENFDPDEKPFITFRHLGSGIKFGEIDGVFRQDKLLIVYGKIDESTPLGSIFEERFNENPEKWGISIGFFPHKYEVMRVNDNIDIRVYTAGELIEVSVLKEDEAAHYFTRIFDVKKDKEIARMGKNREQALAALSEFAGDSLTEDQLEELLDEVDVRNRSIKEQNLVTRDSEVEEVEDVEIQEEEENEEEVSESEPQALDDEELIIEADEELISHITQEVTARVMTNINESLDVLRANSKDMMETLDGILADIREFRSNTDDRLDLLERSDEQKVNDLSADRPSTNRRKVLYRASRDESNKLTEEELEEIGENFDYAKASPEQRQAFLKQQQGKFFKNSISN